MKKFILLFLFLIPFLSFGQDYFFNPFQFGIKTVVGVRVTEDYHFRRLVREKAAEMLNRNYANDVFSVSGETIVSSDPNIEVNQAVREHFGSWYNLLIQAANEVLDTNPNEVSRLATVLGLDPNTVSELKVVNVSIEGGRLTKIYLSPAGTQGSLPRINYCEMGIGQCFLWLGSLVLRFVYSLALFLAVIFLIWAGILYITKPEKSSEIHSRFFLGLLGVIVAVLAFSFVSALERGLSRGGFVSTGGTGTGGTGTGEGSGGAVRGKIEIDEISISLIGNKISGLARLASGNSCNIRVDAINKSRSRIDLEGRSNNRSDNQFTITSTSYLFHDFIDLPNGFFSQGDEIVIFFSSNNCDLNINQYTVRVPVERTVVLDNLEGKIKIRGSQRFQINVSDLSNFRNFLQTILRLTFTASQIYLYQSPYYIIFDASFESVPNFSGECRIELFIRGAEITQIRTDDQTGLPVAASWREFYKRFNFNLPIERGVERRRHSFNINLPNNLYREVRIEINSVRGNCSYQRNLPQDFKVDIND
jgi:hypothetical protein